MKTQVRINVYVPPEIKEKATKKASDLGISLSGLMAVALNDYLKQDSVLDMAAMFKQLNRQMPNDK